jgi:O-antigen/teichoic acid export membrane protein
MNPVQRVAKNISVMFVSQIITYVLAFIFVMYSARYLGVDNFGIMSFALAFSGIMIIFADLGLSSLMVREASRNKKLMESYLKNILSLKLILGISTFIISILIVLALGYNLSDIQVIAIITAYTLLTSLSSMFYALFQTFEKLEYQSIGQIMTSVLLISGALYLIYNKSDLLGFALLYLFVGVIMVLYAFTKK